MKPQIVNIINFIRGVEPRVPGLDLLEPVVNQIRLLKEYKMPGTFLIQYDAMIQNKFSDLLKREYDGTYEIGAWLEIVQPLVEKSGLKWRGRPGFPWDWHADTGFSIGYTPEEREKLVDVFMEDFKLIFGQYPQSVGSWLIDAHTLAYLADKYGIVASCNCRDQWGTDGYTLWGGYYNQAYYPSSRNVFAPAQSHENQINVPVFRMLGSDPIYQYDAGLKTGDGLNPSSFQPVITLEPSYSEDGGGGGVPEWVQWYFGENFNGTCLSFGYTQVGQENSFGWEAMAEGLTYQIKYVSELAAAGKLRVEMLKDSGKWFRSQYKFTPSSAIAAQKDWQNRRHKSFWYYNCFYRVNFFWEADRFWIRDIHRFDEAYPERYLDKKCSEENFIYDNLPVMDGNRWSGGDTRAGICPVVILPDNSTIPLKVGEPVVQELGDDGLKITCPVENAGRLEISCRIDAISVRGYLAKTVFDWGMQMSWNSEDCIPITAVEEKAISYLYNGFSYNLYAKAGYFNKNSENGKILLKPDKSEDSFICLGFEK